MKNKEVRPFFSWWDLIKSTWYFLEGFRGKFVFWTVTLFVVYFYQLVPILFIGKIIDFFSHYSRGASLQTFYVLAVGLGLSYGIASFIRLTAKNKLTVLGTELNYNAKVKGFEKLVDFSLAWHDRENAGNKIERLQNGLNSFTEFRRFVTQDGFQTITAILGIVFAFLFLNPIFVVFLISYLILFSGVNILFYKRLLLMQNELRKVKEKASGSYFEGLSNVLTIKTLGAKDSFKQNIYGAEQRTKDLGFKLISLDYGKWKLFQFFNAVSMVVFLLLVGNSFVQKTISIGAIFVLYTYLIKLVDAAGSSTELIDDLIEIKSSIGRMMPIYWEKEIVVHGNELFPREWTSLQIKNGHFSYLGPQVKNKKDILFEIKGLEFTARKYEKIGIAGSSGSGKSTLAKLLLGLYQLKSGSFMIDETDYYSIKHEEITKEIAIVLQETEMFNLSLEDNITLLRKVKPDILQKAITIAQLESLIKKLPQGLETFIGEKGYRLSGGERQRIGIARAICKDPQIFVFDEATSALDNKTEALIQTALEKELDKKTLIVIAHRISTLKNVDRICVFEKGNIVEEGTYDKLITNTKSKFYEISQVQGKK